MREGRPPLAHRYRCRTSATSNDGSGASSKACSPRRSEAALQPVELAKRLIKEMDAERTVGLNEVWAPNRFAFALSTEDADRFHQAEAALASELAQVARENAEERGWGLVGPPEITFSTDESLKRGAFPCVASLVQGPDDGARPSSPAATAYLVIRENGAERRRSRREGGRHDRPARGVRRRAEGLRRFATPCPTPNQRGGHDPHRPGVHERHETQRPDRAGGQARGRRPHHDRHHGAGVPEGLTVAANLHLVAEGVTPFALSALKYGLFALLVLFLWRSMRWAVRGLTVEAAPARGARMGRKAREEADNGPTVTPACPTW